MKRQPTTWIAFVAALLSSSAGLMAGDDDAEYAYVRMKTTEGDFLIELNRGKAPLSVENFLGYVDDGFYTDTVFHRVVSNFVVQGGGMIYGDDYQFVKKETKPAVQNEAKNGLKNTYGTIAMARTSAPHSATSQFYINVVDNNRLDYPAHDGWGYCVFGKVIDGMNAVERIHKKGAKPGVADGAAKVIKVERVKYEDIKSIADKAHAEDKAAADKSASDAERNKKMQLEEAKSFVAKQGADISGAKVTDSGLWVIDVKEGTGDSPKSTNTVKVHYTGWLTNGSKFDSSRDRESPATFPLNGVIAGWTEGVGSMKVGGKRFLIIPSELGYGARGAGARIPPNSMLVFEVELLEIVK